MNLISILSLVLIGIVYFGFILICLYEILVRYCTTKYLDDFNKHIVVDHLFSHNKKYSKFNDREIKYNKIKMALNIIFWPITFLPKLLLPRKRNLL